jgi:serine protease Do
MVDPEGYIITNAHVVTGAQRRASTSSCRSLTTPILAARSRTVKASIVGIDLETDLAVIKVDEWNLAALPFGDSDAACTRTPRGLTHTQQRDLSQHAQPPFVVSF